MKKIKIYVVLCLVMAFMLNIVSYAATEDGKESKKFLSEQEAVTQTQQLKKEESIIVSGDQFVNYLNDDESLQIKDFGFDISKVKDVKIITDQKSSKEYKKFEIKDNQYIIFDTNNELLTICNIKEKTNISKSIKNEKDEIDRVTKKIAKYYKFGDEYLLTSSEEFDEDYWNIVWTRQLANGAINPYDSVNVTIDRRDFSVVFLNRFSENVEVIEPIIKEKNAINNIGELLNLFETKIESIELTYAYPNNYWNDSYEETKVISLELVYQIIIDEGNKTINVSAISGDIIGGDISKSECAGSYGQTNSGLTHSGDSVDLAADGMATLGYSPSWYKKLDTSSLKSYITTHLNRSDAYGFYFCGHGSSSTTDPILAVRDKNDADNVVLRSSEVSGNWHFVFLDACHTGRTIWSNSFNITSSTNDRAYLGWDGKVGITEAYDFAQEFWPLVGTMSIRDAAVYAASQVTGSTPIRFFGDSSYDGSPY